LDIANYVAILGCLITGYESLIEGLKLPDPKDLHVPAAAIKAGAQVIVTANLKHFACVQAIADARNHPPESIGRSNPLAGTSTRTPPTIHTASIAMTWFLRQQERGALISSWGVNCGDGERTVLPLRERVGCCAVRDPVAETPGPGILRGPVCATSPE
jgi:hypothetical protein